MIQMILRINVPGRRWSEALSLLRPIMEPTRVQGDCLSCSLQQDLEHRSLLQLVQEWSSEEALQQHFCSEAYRRVLVAMELSVDAPQLRFRSIQDISVLETVGPVHPN